MVHAFSYVIALTLVQQLVVGAEWLTGIIGGGGGVRRTLICSTDSWIDEVKGGIYDWFSLIGPCVTNFEAKCTDGQTLGFCGSGKTSEIKIISNANGFDSVGGAIESYQTAAYVGDLSFYLNGDFLGSINDTKNQQTLVCPENEVVMGLAVRCGAIMDAIELYCGSPEGYPTVIPTPTPSNIPTSNPTQTPTLMPTNPPTSTPTNSPTPMPTNVRTLMPTNPPTAIPTVKPTGIPTSTPTESPTSDPTVIPTSSPSETPTTRPTNVPTWIPTILPTLRPTSSCPETVEQLEIVIDYLMDYLFCMKHAPNPDECNGTHYKEFATLNTVKKN